MIDPYSLVAIYDDGLYADDTPPEDATYIIIAHNLIHFEAVRVAERLIKQFEMNAVVIRHINHHEETDATVCTHCISLLDSLIEVAISKRPKEAVTQ